MIKKTLIILVSLFILFTGAQTVFADYGLKETGKTAFGKTPTGSIQGTIGNVIGAGLTMVGVLFLVLMIYGGVIWMLARGNEQQSKKALDTIIAAVIGLVIVLGSYALTKFVFTSVQDKSASTGGCVDVEITPLTGCSMSEVDCSSYTEGTCATNNGNNCCEWK